MDAFIKRVVKEAKIFEKSITKLRKDQNNIKIHVVTLERFSNGLYIAHKGHNHINIWIDKNWTKKYLTTKEEWAAFMAHRLKGEVYYE